MEHRAFYTVGWWFYITFGSKSDWGKAVSAYGGWIVYWIPDRVGNDKVGVVYSSLVDGFPDRVGNDKVEATGLRLLPLTT